MKLVSIGCGGFADLGFGVLRDQQVPRMPISGILANVAMISAAWSR